MDLNDSLYFSVQLLTFSFWNYFQRERELNRELFGNTPFLPMEDHKKLFQETGIDIDGKKCHCFTQVVAYIDFR